MAAELLVRDLLPLYRGFIHDHRLRLDAIGRHDLATAFAEWGRRLAARPS